MEQYIQKAIGTFYNLIKDKEEGAPDTRYKSWEWCYQAFAKGRKKYASASDNENEKESIVDYLALHLGFYLASWGMYRGSSYLLQRDYKAHKKVVKILLDENYSSLWGYKPQALSAEELSEQNKLIFGKTALYNQIKNAYNGYVGVNEDDPSDTLVTKILMGTMGCVPAFDRFLKEGIKWLNQNFSAEYGDISRTIENKGENAGKTFDALERFAFHNQQHLKVQSSTVEYPVMKCVDMFFWQIGFEIDLMKKLQNPKTSQKQKARLKNTAIKMGLCEPNAEVDEIIGVINQRWSVNGTV